MHFVLIPVSFSEFLKQESDGYPTNKPAFTEFEDTGLETKSLNHAGKNCVPYGLNCSYRTQSSEDSGASGSPSPARTLQVPCFGDTSQQRFENDKGEQQKDTGGVFCDAAQTFGSGPRPKIWSLARTATSNSPPLIRRFPCPTDYCLDNDQKEDIDCAKMKTAYNSCSVPYPDYAQDRTARKNPAEELCCDTRAVYVGVLPSCSVSAKCESTDCLGPPSDRNSCMVSSHCNYAAEYTSGGTEQYPYAEKQFKNKDLCAIEYPTSKCQALEGAMDSQPPKKMTPTIMPYPVSEHVARTDFYNSATSSFEQGMGTVHKSAPN